MTITCIYPEDMSVLENKLIDTLTDIAIQKFTSEEIDLIVILAIILVVFAFSSMSVINAMGLFMFWGWIVTVLGNLIFTIPYLYIIKDKE